MEKKEKVLAAADPGCGRVPVNKIIPFSAVDGPGNRTAADHRRQDQTGHIRSGKFSFRLHGNGKDLIGDSKGHQKPLNPGHFLICLLGHGKGHEKIADIDNHCGDGDLQITASGQHQARTCKLTGAG